MSEVLRFFLNIKKGQIHTHVHTHCMTPARYIPDVMKRSLRGRERHKCPARVPSTIRISLVLFLSHHDSVVINIMVSAVNTVQRAER